MGVKTPRTPQPAAAASASTRPSASKSGNQSVSLAEAVTTTWNCYIDKTSPRVKYIDGFLAFLVLLGGLQFAYCVLAGSYPFNAFLSGFSATVGQFVLTVSLRMQSGPKAEAVPERVFADYVFGSILLHFFCVNFIN